MGAKVTKSLWRAARNVNLENRAMDALARDKPQVAPRHRPAPGAELPPQEREAIAERLRSRDDALLDNLQSVRVHSTDPPARVLDDDSLGLPSSTAAGAAPSSSTTTTSPRSSSSSPRSPPGRHRDPLVRFPAALHGGPHLAPAAAASAVPLGRLTVAEAVLLLGLERAGPAARSAASVARQFGLDERSVRALRDHFHAFDMRVEPAPGKRIAAAAAAPTPPPPRAVAAAAAAGAEGAPVKPT